MRARSLSRRAGGERRLGFGPRREGSRREPSSAARSRAETRRASRAQAPHRARRPARPPARRRRSRPAWLRSTRPRASPPSPGSWRESRRVDRTAIAMRAHGRLASRARGGRRGRRCRRLDPRVDLGLEHRQRHRAVGEDGVVEARGRRSGRRAPSRPRFRSSADLQLPHLVAERLAGPRDVAVDLRSCTSWTRQRRVRTQVLDGLRARPAHRVDARVHDEAAGPPHLVGQPAEVAVGVLVEAGLEARAAPSRAPSPRRTRRRRRSGGTAAGPSAPAESAIWR